MSDDYETPEDRKARRKAEKLVRGRIAQDDAVLQTIMSRTDGRAWMHDLLAFCQVFSSTFTGEALSGAFREGQRNVGLRVFSDVMRACPDAYIQMMKEANLGGRPESNTDPDFDDDGRWIGDGEDPRQPGS